MLAFSILYNENKISNNDINWRSANGQIYKFWGNFNIYFYNVP